MAAERPGAAVPRPQSSGAEESARLSALRGYCVLDTGRESRFDDLTCLAASICETPYSLVSLVDVVPRQLNAKQLETLRILGRQAMCQLELNLQAMRDPLTGLYNRRQLEESLHREVLRARRIGSPVGVMAIDVDHFKRVNDTLGHEVGDGALRGIAEELASCVR